MTAVREGGEKGTKSSGGERKGRRKAQRAEVTGAPVTFTPGVSCSGCSTVLTVLGDIMLRNALALACSVHVQSEH